MVVTKNNLGPVLALYPMPVTIVGSIVNGKPNFAAVAHVGIMNYSTPQYISVGLSKSHFTNQGIVENKEFSVCIPSESSMVKTDFIGLVSGKKADKSKLFEVTEGVLSNAPMVEECPVCMQCKLFQTIDMRTHDIFIGEIVGTYCDNEVMTDGAIDLTKVKPMLFDMGSKQYWSLGKPIGKAWSVGKKMMK